MIYGAPVRGGGGSDRAYYLRIFETGRTDHDVNTETFSSPHIVKFTITNIQTFR